MPSTLITWPVWRTSSGLAVGATLATSPAENDLVEFQNSPRAAERKRNRNKNKKRGERSSGALLLFATLPGRGGVVSIFISLRLRRSPRISRFAIMGAFPQRRENVKGRTSGSKDSKIPAGKMVQATTSK
jgi:hypothetical protein